MERVGQADETGMLRRHGLRWSRCRWGMIISGVYLEMGWLWDVRERFLTMTPRSLARAA